MATLELRSLHKKFDQTPVIHGVDLQVAHGEFVVFVGPSGCGKSTLLRMIAGLDTPTDGDLLIDGQRVNDVGAAERGCAMVFQSYALYPHMTVYANMAFGLENAKVPRAEIERKVHEAATLLRLDPLLQRRPTQLSGGQRQRVAIGRAIVRNPKIFLFDEPLSNLDAELRVSMRSELRELHQRLGATMIYVTHDQVEAMTMADKIVVLNAGRIEQVGSPLDLYRNPANTFVAGFIGSPKMNLITGAEAAKHNATTIGVRPEHLDITADGPWHGTVGLSEHLGSDTFLKVAVAGMEPITVRAGGDLNLRPGDKIGLAPQAGKLHRFGQDGKALA